jgi:alginate O-acetyltransferase complex protein AlgI
VYYGILLIIEKVILLKVLEKTPNVLRHIYAMFIVLLGWALFYFEDMTALGAFFARAFSSTGSGTAEINIILGYLPLFLVSAVAATPLGAACWKKLRTKSGAAYVGIGIAGVLLLLCVAALASSSYNPFIYFRF